jgi:hypothetical protein
MRERGYNVFSAKLLSRTAGEGGPSLKGLVGEGLAHTLSTPKAQRRAI